MRFLPPMVIIALLALQGCSTISVEKLPTSGRYIVVTRFGNGLVFEKIGTTIFNNDYQVFEDDTDVGKAFQDKIVATLNQDSSWTYVATDIKLAAPKFDPNIDTYTASIQGDWKTAAADLDLIKKAAAENHVDIVIYVTESVAGGVMGTNQSMVGRGLFKRSFLGLKDINRVYLAYRMTLYDAHTWETLDRYSTAQDRFADFEWPLKNGPIPVDLQQQTRQALTALEPPKDVPYALCYFGLTRYTHDPINQNRIGACSAQYGRPLY